MSNRSSLDNGVERRPHSRGYFVTIAQHNHYNSYTTTQQMGGRFPGVTHVSLFQGEILLEKKNI